MFEVLIDFFMYLLSPLVDGWERFWVALISGVVSAVFIFWLIPGTTLRLVAAGTVITLGAVLGVIWQAKHSRRKERTDREN